MFQREPVMWIIAAIDWNGAFIQHMTIQIVLQWDILKPEDEIENGLQVFIYVFLPNPSMYPNHEKCAYNFPIGLE